MKILIVEDDKQQADTLARLLEKVSASKVTIFIAGTLAEGVAKSWDLKVDITYLDLSLPDAPVETVIKSIKQMYPPVIVITALEDDDKQSLKLNCFAHGAQNFFRKPTDIKLLVPHLLSTGAAAHLRREAPRLLANEPI